MANKKVLITGATGAIGQEILSQLQELNRLEGITVLARKTSKNQKILRPFRNAITIVHGDICNQEYVTEACEHQDVVIHLAAIIPTVEENTTRCTEVNYGGTVNVVNAMKKVNPKAFLLYSSSIAVYGDRLENPMIHADDALDDQQHDQYAMNKIRAETYVRKSGLSWSILRLTAIMGIGNHQISEKMFEVPLKTKMEIATVRDTARAFVHALDKTSQLNRKVFNLGGGEQCRITYEQFLSRAFKSFGLGKVNFPEYAFAKQNFHCGYYSDGHLLEEILQFRNDDIDSYFDRFEKSVPRFQKLATIPFSGIVKKYLLGLSKPYKAFKKRQQDQIKFYFGPK